MSRYQKTLLRPYNDQTLQKIKIKIHHMELGVGNGECLFIYVFVIFYRYVEVKVMFGNVTCIHISYTYEDTFGGSMWSFSWLGHKGKEGY